MSEADMSKHRQLYQQVVQSSTIQLDCHRQRVEDGSWLDIEKWSRAHNNITSFAQYSSDRYLTSNDSNCGSPLCESGKMEESASSKAGLGLSPTVSSKQYFNPVGIIQFSAGAIVSAPNEPGNSSAESEANKKNQNLGQAIREVIGDLPGRWWSSTIDCISGGPIMVGAPGDSDAEMEAQKENEILKEKLSSVTTKFHLGSSCASADQSACIPLGTVPSSKTFSMPPSTEWGSQCPNETTTGGCPKGSLQFCLEPDTNPEYTCSPCSDDSFRYIPDIFRCSDEIDKLIRDAWCMLRENLDIVEWAMCMVVGCGDVLECTIDRIKSPGEGFAIRCLSTVSDDAGPGTPCSSTGGRLASGWWLDDEITTGVDFCVTNSRLIALANINCCSTDPRERLCAVVQFASILLHELSHTCKIGGDDMPGNCDCTYLLSSTFLWAMLQRYPASMDAFCCRAVFGDYTTDYGVSQNVFMTDQSLTNTNGCTTSC